MNVQKAAFISFITMVAVVGAFITYHLQLGHFVRDPLLVFKDTTGEEEPTIVKAGGTFSFERIVCAKQDMIVTVHRELISSENDRRYILGNVEYVSLKNVPDCQPLVFTTNVPNSVPEGRYTYQPTLVFSNSLLKKSVQTAPGKLIVIH